MTSDRRPRNPASMRPPNCFGGNITRAGFSAKPAARFNEAAELASAETMCNPGDRGPRDVRFNEAAELLRRKHIQLLRNLWNANGFNEAAELLRRKHATSPASTARCSGFNEAAELLRRKHVP